MTALVSVWIFWRTIKIIIIIIIIGLVITVNFNAFLYSDCQLADDLYHYSHICITVINI